MGSRSSARAGWRSPVTTSMWPLWASGPCPCRERSRLQPWPTALQALPAASVCETPRQETLLSRQGLKLSSISQGQIRAESSRRRVDSAVPGKVALRSRCRFAGSVLPVPTNYTRRLRPCWTLEGTAGRRGQMPSRLGRWGFPGVAWQLGPLPTPSLTSPSQPEPVAQTPLA